ncbi:hypothetical protein LRP67_10865 [Nocardioides sp. cx-169]|uniref:hypothetical protein n=1 Tax=Nocardioides sp. cx-169 TaxID=2899080 RepID=UPI001E59842F|nr:hypothetical protein [Nocardioides sp. cx-169]MCD4534583.1 hypothetical protein [Nocardioides sp. cx-169]
MRLGHRLLPVVLLAFVAATLAVPASATPASATAERAPRVIAREVAFDVANTSEALLRCPSDQEMYGVRGRLVGPERDVLGRGGPLRVNVLVHDAGTGGWFWNLRRHPRYDYATQLARQGETSLVLDRLGYDGSPLPNGRATCLDAQAHMLHQVVQRLRSGRYDFTKGRTTTPHASHVVVQAHGVGGAIAQLEAGRFDDIDGLVLMSWAGTHLSDLALRQAEQQSAACLQGSGYAPYGPSAAQYRALLFTSAPAAVQQTAVRRRNPTPCGDVTSLASVVLSSALTAGRVEAPVLLLSGSRDARVHNQAAQAAATFTSSEKVTARVLAGAGSALPLERSAPRTRRLVLQWLRGL